MISKDWVEQDDPDCPEWPIYQMSTYHDEALGCDVLLVTTRLGGRALYHAHRIAPGVSLDRLRGKLVRGLGATVSEFRSAGYGPHVWSEEGLE